MHANRSFPVLRDIKRPFELEMGVIVIVNELGNGIVVSSSNHARRGFLLVDCEPVSA